VAGSSRTLLEATDRYSPPSMAELIGAMPEKFVARETAELMAERAYRRAMLLSDGADGCLGVGCTATIATDRVKRGEHGCWVAVYSNAGVRAYGLVIEKGLRDRSGEEELVSRLLVRAIAEAAGAGDLPLNLSAEEQLDVEYTARRDPLVLLLAGQAQSVMIHPDGTAVADEPFQGGLLSGSFNPLPAGHEQLAQVASVVLGAPVAFEIPIVNADKPPLPYGELVRRAAQFAGRYTMLLSRAPRFVDKAAIYPGCTFVLGYDTAVRVVDPRFYEGPKGVSEALDVIRAQGCRFLVAGRLVGGQFHTLADIELPPEYADLFIELPATMFRSDLSSTAIRNSREAGSHI
ncbi:MAG TPA: hypothetical protein VFT99_21795, partial [Roseiflexaceae bacterium]|nr:hypothetical protein [Roseiflexaceae bacterium]